MGHKLEIKSDDFCFYNSEILLDGMPLHCNHISIDGGFEKPNGPTWDVTVTFPCTVVNFNGDVLDNNMKERVQERYDYFKGLLDIIKKANNNYSNKK